MIYKQYMEGKKTDLIQYIITNTPAKYITIKLNQHLSNKA